MSSNDRHLAEGQVGETLGAQGHETTEGGLVDLSGLTLSDLRDLRDAGDESCLARALSRVLSSTEVDGHHGFQSKI